MTLHYIYKKEIPHSCYKIENYFDFKKCSKDCFYRDGDKFTQMIELSHLSCVQGFTDYLFNQLLEIHNNIDDGPNDWASYEDWVQYIVKIYAVALKFRRLLTALEYNAEEIKKSIDRIFIKNANKIMTTSKYL